MVRGLDMRMKKWILRRWAGQGQTMVKCMGMKRMGSVINVGEGEPWR
jgi:hypothetical protein